MRTWTDPAMRPLRRFLLLVILTVATPSLLLSGFGLIAIDSERDVALQRVRALYRPVLDKLTDRVRERLAQIVTDCRTPLQGLRAYALGESADPGPEFTRFRKEVPFSANYFVLDARQQPLIPRVRPATPDWQPSWSPDFLQARDQEFRHKRPGLAASGYQGVLAGLGERDPLRCHVLNALARTRFKAGDRAAAVLNLNELIAKCPDTVDENGYHLALGARLRLVEDCLHQTACDWSSRLADLAAHLRDPGHKASRGQVGFVARRVLSSLAREKLDQRDRTLEVIRAAAGWDEMLAPISRISGLVGNQPGLYSVEVDGIEHLLVLVRSGELSGFELLPEAMGHEVQTWLEEMQIASGLRAEIKPSSSPISEQQENLSAGTNWLKDGWYAWRLGLVVTGAGSLDELAASRTRLYLWMLILLVITLLLGIASTIWLMVRQSRLSRLKTDFVSSVSHELRTPLTSIRLFTETLLLDRVSDENERRECLQIIGTESERLSRLVERILDFSRMEAGRRAYRFEPVDVTDLVDTAIAACRPLVNEKEFVIERRLPDDLPKVPGDRDALIEVLINLLSNAIKYSPEHKQVTVSAQVDGDWLRLSVMDQGMGIPRSEHKRIFERFYRVAAPLASDVSGSGLGLSLVEYIVRAHSGEVEVVSAPGKGSTFTVSLPLEAPPSRAARASGPGGFSDKREES